MHRCRMLIWVGLSVLPTTITAAADWPQWLGPTRNGVAGETVAAWTDAPRIRWRTPVTPGFSSPVVADGRVCVHLTEADSEAEAVVAYALDSGAELWRQSYPRARYRSELGAGPRATPAVSANRLVSLGITGELSCFDATTGALMWRQNPYDQAQASTPGFGVCSSPLIVDGKVIVMLSGLTPAARCYDLESGALSWQSLDEPGGAASPTVMRSNSGGSLVVAQTTLRVAALSLDEGQVHWDHSLVFEPNGVSPTPLATGAGILCTTQDSGALLIRPPSDGPGGGELAWWNHDLSSYFSTGARHGDEQVLFVRNQVMPLPRADLVALNLKTGQPEWEQPGLGYFHLGVIRLSDGKFLLLDDAGKITLSDVKEGRFHQLCSAPVCQGTFCNPALSRGCVIVRDRQELICVELPAGNSQQP